MSWAIAGVLALGVGIGIWIFNGLVRARNLVDAAWADVDVQLQKRHDLVPRLVRAVRAYAEHEQGTLVEVVRHRDQAVRAQDVAEKSAVEDQLAGDIQKLVLLAEAYPELKAGENYAELARDLVEIEDHLQYARRFYNGAVRDYNNRVERVPDRFVADGFGFASAAYFQADDESRKTISVDL